MHPAMTQTLTEAHIAERHREAAHHRLTHTAVPHRPGVLTGMAGRLAALRLAVARLVADRTRPVAAERASCPACCPA